MTVRSLRLAGALLAVAPSIVFAQGRFGRGRGPGHIQTSEGVTVPSVVNPVNLLLAHRQDLALSDSQFMRVIRVKRALDSANAPLMRRLDSVQHLFKGGKAIFEDPSPLRRDSLMEANSLVQETVAGVRDNISGGRSRAYALLSPDQLDKARQYEADAEKAIEETEKARGRGKP